MVGWGVGVDLKVLSTKPYQVVPRFQSINKRKGIAHIRGLYSIISKMAASQSLSVVLL